MQKIAYLSASKDNSEAKFRYLAYKDILQDYNIQFDDDLVAPYDFWTEESGARGIETLIGKRNKKFDALAAASDPIAIDAESVQKRQLLQNLISNALKFNKPDCPPIVKIYTKIIKDSGKKFCEITVGDNGIGIENKYFEHVFKVFQRLHGN